MRIPLRDLRRAILELAPLRGRFIDNVYQCGPRTFLLKLKPETIVVDLEPGQWYDPEFLKALAPASLMVTIESGARRVQNIRVNFK